MAASSPTPDPEQAAAILAAQERFIGLWGEMGSAWGIPRTMAEVHALLFIGGDPMNTDEVIERLEISRGNASMTLRTLCDWGLVSRVHNRGDRKDYFRAESDVWKMFAIIVRERKRREFDPLLEALHHCRAMTGAPAPRRTTEPTELAVHHERLDAMLGLVQTLDTLSDRIITPGGTGLRTAAKLLTKVS